VKVLFLWTDISGYMAACWSALSHLPDVDVRVMAYASSHATAFRRDLMAGLDWIPLDDSQRYDAGFLQSAVHEWKPDVIVVSGWLNRAYRRMPALAARPGRRFFMTMDMPWRGTLKQQIGRVVLGAYCRRFDMVVTTGERSWQYAKRLGVPENRIARGLYGVDHAAFAGILDVRIGETIWPRRFLFAGRYAPEKGLDLLVNAYREYRGRVSDPWPLTCCGQGPLRDRLRGIEGLEDRGFVQPSELHDIMASSGAFILPSLFDPWPLALAEACSAGLPVIASNACGSAVELIRDGYSGFMFPTGDREGLVRALCRVHASPQLPEIGRRAREYAAAYSAEEWARRWRELIVNA
jgi:glycosyltransferase involved in cell wall biosynthesis